MSDHVQPYYCEANLCGKRTDGAFMCPHHARMAPPELLAAIARTEHRGVFVLADNADTRDRLELYAEAVEAVARATRAPIENQYRRRLHQLEQARRAATAPAKQERLLETEPTSSGPYGPGTGRDRP
jgi:hypothetical protein